MCTSLHSSWIWDTLHRICTCTHHHTHCTCTLAAARWKGRGANLSTTTPLRAAAHPAYHTPAHLPPPFTLPAPPHPARRAPRHLRRGFGLPTHPQRTSHTHTFCPSWFRLVVDQHWTGYTDSFIFSYISFSGMVVRLCFISSLQIVPTFRWVHLGPVVISSFRTQARPSLFLTQPACYQPPGRAPTYRFAATRTAHSRTAPLLSLPPPLGGRGRYNAPLPHAALYTLWHRALPRAACAAQRNFCLALTRIKRTHMPACAPALHNALSRLSYHT